jgi:phosphatidate cytidylyltransferase
VIEAILTVTLAGFSLGAVVMAVGNRDIPAQAARARWYKLAVYFVIVHVVLVAAALGRPWVVVLLCVVLLAATAELGHAWQRIAAPRPAAVWPLFLAAAAAALWNATRLTPEAFAFLFLAAAAGDGFAQVVGQWLGQRKLAPRVSPAKTVEGFLGGLCAAGSVAAFASALVGLTPARAALLGLMTGVAGLVGDLAASWVKRRAGIKDYSGALPGQGGFLDRFDSLLGALAFAGWCL